MTPKIILKRLKLHNTIWHPESGLVFRSEKIKKVIGKFKDDEISVPDNLSELCNLWKFKLDETVFEEIHTEEDTTITQQKQSDSEEDNDPEDTITQQKQSDSEDDQLQDSEHDQETDNDEKEEEQTNKKIKTIANIEFTELRNHLFTFSKLMDEQISNTEIKMTELQRVNKSLYCEIGKVKNENEKMKMKFETIKNIFK